MASKASASLLGDDPCASKKRAIRDGGGLSAKSAARMARKARRGALQVEGEGAVDASDALLGVLVISSINFSPLMLF